MATATHSFRISRETDERVLEFMRQNDCSRSTALRLLVERGLGTSPETADAREGVLQGQRVLLTAMHEVTRAIHRVSERVGWGPEKLSQVGEELRLLLGKVG